MARRTAWHTGASKSKARREMEMTNLYLKLVGFNYALVITPS